jgi:hypothetical protein
MRSPVVVQIASIIPGLGLWIVGKRREAVIVALLFSACVVFFLFSPWDTISQLAFFAGIMLWAVQIGVAYYEAMILKKIAKENYQRAREVGTIGAPPPHLNRTEKMDHKWSEMLSRQLQPGERLLTHIYGRQVGLFQTWSSTSFYRVALLEDKIMLMILSIFNKPAIFRKIAFDGIETLELQKGLVSDTLKIKVKGEKLLRLQVTRNQRERAMRIMDSMKRETTETLSG